MIHIQAQHQFNANTHNAAEARNFRTRWLDRLISKTQQSLEADAQDYIKIGLEPHGIAIHNINLTHDAIFTRKEN